MMTSKMETVELTPGYEISRLIHGGWQSRDADASRVLPSLQAHAEAGITAFETSDTYAGGEEVLGRFLRQRRADSSHPLRVHTRYTVGRNAALPDKTGVEAAIDSALSRLGIERIDLMQLQWWPAPGPRMIEFAGWLSELADSGKIAHLGVTNFSTRMLSDLTSAGIAIISNQVQYSLIDRRAGAAMADYCRRHGVALLAYGPLAGGFLTATWRGRDDPRSAGKPMLFSPEYRLMIDLFGGWARYQELLTTLDGIAAMHNVGLPSVAARWVLDRPSVKAVLLGASSARNLAQNLALLDFNMTAAERRAIDDVLARNTPPSGDIGELERDPDGPLLGLIKSAG